MGRGLEEWGQPRSFLTHTGFLETLKKGSKDDAAKREVSKGVFWRWEGRERFRRKSLAGANKGQKKQFDMKEEVEEQRTGKHKNSGRSVGDVGWEKG